MKTFETISSVTRLPKKEVGNARKKAEIIAVLQVIAEKQHMSAQEFEAICKDNNVTAKTVLQYVKHDTDYVISKIYDFIPWDEVDDNAEIPFTGYSNSGVQVFQEMDGVYVCEVIKTYYFPCCYEISFNYYDIVSGSVLTEEYPSLSLPIFKKAVENAVSPENFQECAQEDLDSAYDELCSISNRCINYNDFWHSYDIDGKMRQYYDDFLENLVFERKELPITKENMNSWYNILDCIAFHEIPEFELN